MAKQTVNIGSAANDGTGDPLRTAFDKLNDNFDEVYADDFVTTARLADDSVTEVHLDVTNSPVDGYVLEYDSGSGGFTWGQKFDGDITGIVAGNGLTGDATSGDASLAVGAGTGITVNANDVQIADDGVDHDQLAARYTESSAVTSSAAITIDTSSADIFTWTAGHSTTVAFTNVEVGSTCVLAITGGGSSYTLALGNINGSAGTFNRLGGTYDDTSSTKNLIEFKFISTSEAWYQISQIAS